MIIPCQWSQMFLSRNPDAAAFGIAGKRCGPGLNLLLIPWFNLHIRLLDSLWTMVVFGIQIKCCGTSLPVTFSGSAAGKRCSFPRFYRFFPSMGISSLLIWFSVVLFPQPSGPGWPIRFRPVFQRYDDRSLSRLPC